MRSSRTAAKEKFSRSLPPGRRSSSSTSLAAGEHSPGRTSAAYVSGTRTTSPCAGRDRYPHPRRHWGLADQQGARLRRGIPRPQTNPLVRQPRRPRNRRPRHRPHPTPRPEHAPEPRPNTIARIPGAPQSRLDTEPQPPTTSLRPLADTLAQPYTPPRRVGPQHWSRTLSGPLIALWPIPAKSDMRLFAIPQAVRSAAYLHQR